MTDFEKGRMTVLIKEKARELGFDLCGIAKARILTEYKPFMNAWCEAGMNGQMVYICRDIEKRLDPANMFTGVKSLVVTGLSYKSEIKQKHPGVPLLSRYAYGEDYHKVITGKLENLLAFIKRFNSDSDGRAVVDSAPIPEKPWAREAGLGWRGRHSIMINKKTGSFFFIGILLLNIELSYDDPYEEDHCGDCRLCIDSCPTGAINENRTIDARKCIANLTIENRGPVPEEIIPKLGRRVYGCDRCQEVCPWNREAGHGRTPEFTLSEEIAGMDVEEWKSLTQAKFTSLFKGSALERVKYDQFMRNVNIALNHSD
ncbi:MAG: tRNA epoxyqueuosine(34) reductase QueG [Bacteroidales bacterium]